MTTTAVAAVPEVETLSYRDARRALYRVSESQWRNVDKYAVEGLEFSPYFEGSEPSSLIGHLIADLVGPARFVAVDQAIDRNGHGTTIAQALALAGYAIDPQTEALLARVEAYADDCYPFGDAVRRGMRTPE